MFQELPLKDYRSVVNQLPQQIEPPQSPGPLVKLEQGKRWSARKLFREVSRFSSPTVRTQSGWPSPRAHFRHLLE
jgi:hypothetical protein